MLFVSLAALSALIVALMIRVGALDHPVARSSHTRPTPKGGGVGIAAAFATGVAVELARGQASAADIVLTAAALFLAAASYMDDVRQWPFWLKLAAQCAAAAAIVAAGLVPLALSIPGFGALGLPGAVAAMLAMGWLLFTTNAVNFMDGLNGLAAGSVAICCAVLALADPKGAWLDWLLVAGVAGFLPFNYPSARIFMGDVGSQFLGFLLAALALRHAGESRLMPVLPLGLSPMLLDVAFTLIRRWRRGERLTEAHRSHFYQVAQRAGMPAWLVSAVYWSMSGWAAVCGVAWGATSEPVWFGVAITPILLWGFYASLCAARARIEVW
jgi:UDP-GlcNAc:undecaprenyl-phosphate GlcNAc-1-phosphate transferase